MGKDDRLLAGWLAGWLAGLLIPAKPLDLKVLGLFFRSGDLWIVRFNEVMTFIQHSKGMELICHLLSTPNEEIAAIQLSQKFNSGNYSIPDANEQYSKMCEVELSSEGLSRRNGESIRLNSKASNALGKTIRRSVTLITKERYLPELGMHLKAALLPIGPTLCYRPRAQINWTVKKEQVETI